mgnify:CR=1 FL=1
MRKILAFTLLILAFSINNLFSQDFLEGSKISGSVQVDAQLYKEDTIIGAEKVSEQMLSNGFLYLNYTQGSFNAGIRYEFYYNPLLGIDPRYKGAGIPYRFLEFKSDIIEATVGNFYEQFGSGVIFRSYEERQLGIDNSIEGVRVKFYPVEGISFTGLLGKQRNFWSLGPGIIRGGDLNVVVNQLFENILPKSLQLALGGSIISKYQPDTEVFYNLPENVLAYSTRASISGEAFMLDGEFAYKYNDPSASNYYNYNPGTALIINASYFPKGLGLSLNLHRIDNMDFRTDRDVRGNNLLINYIPPLTQQHTYRLASMFPYSTQLGGEVGMQAEFTYQFPPETFLGGKYGTTINLNYSRIHNLDTTHTEDLRYDSPFFKIGERLYFQDINLTITKRWDKDFKTNLTLINIINDRDITENDGAPKFGKVYTTTAVLEMNYKLNARNSIRAELHHLWSNQDSTLKAPDNLNGNWAMLLLEYTIAPKWYFSVFDEYNYNNEKEDYRVHYLGGSIAYIHSGTRVSIGYGRQRGGTICVGGVCRVMPASNGFNLSITSSF